MREIDVRESSQYAWQGKGGELRKLHWLGRARQEIWSAHEQQGEITVSNAAANAKANAGSPQEISKGDGRLRHKSEITFPAAAKYSKCIKGVYVQQEDVKMTFIAAVSRQQTKPVKSRTKGLIE